ncbi:MAG: hypothetical protein R3B70_29300 [Polyangiaceae bacterium]
MARFSLSLNEGSLLRRTALHVAAFVLGTAAFLAIASFVLITVMKSVLPSEEAASGSSSGSDDSAESAPATTSKASTKPARPPRKKRTAPVIAPPSAPADDE